MRIVTSGEPGEESKKRAKEQENLGIRKERDVAYDTSEDKANNNSDDDETREAREMGNLQRANMANEAASSSSSSSGKGNKAKMWKKSKGKLIARDVRGERSRRRVHHQKAASDMKYEEYVSNLRREIHVLRAQRDDALNRLFIHKKLNLKEIRDENSKAMRPDVPVFRQLLFPEIMLFEGK